MTKNKRILLIITGSIAAYKAMDLVRLLKKSPLVASPSAAGNREEIEITCVMTKAAQEFITPLLVESIAQNKVYTELFSKEDELEMGHINLSRSNDLILVAPASADFIAKIANGYADDLASAVILASDKKVFVVPAMNEKMWLNSVTQENIAKLAGNGFLIIEPEIDVLACGEYGVGKMSAPEKIVSEVENFFKNKDLLKGKRILVTGGATYEPIDPVRFIGNYSSGKQAIEIVKALRNMGAEVVFVAANIKSSIIGDKNSTISVKTTDEMLIAVEENLAGIDVFIGCAAVADYKVAEVAKTKIKKTAADDLTLKLVKNVDILAMVGKSKQRPKLVIGFAAESENIITYAKEKLLKKNCDLIVANDIEDGAIFNNSLTKAYFIGADLAENLGKISKKQLAEKLVQLLVSRLL